MAEFDSPFLVNLVAAFQASCWTGCRWVELAPPATLVDGWQWMLPQHCWAVGSPALRTCVTCLPPALRPNVFTSHLPSARIVCIPPAGQPQPVHGDGAGTGRRVLHVPAGRFCSKPCLH